VDVTLSVEVTLDVAKTISALAALLIVLHRIR